MRDPRHPRHFTEYFKRQIVDLYNAGKSKREIMDEQGLGKSAVERRIKSINATGSPRAADNRTPEQNQTSDGWMFFYRSYGLADVYENKLAGIYLHAATT